jgi:cytoskeletal protein CcmA (bactofilin family)
MWRKEEAKPQGVPQSPAPPAASIPQRNTNNASVSVPASSASLPVSPHATACLTQGIRIKGEITGKEDLFLDGAVEGKLDLGNASVTVGPNGKVKADISARDIVVRGQVEGMLDATERVQLWNSGRVEGEVRTERLGIEDGAVLRGKVEAGREPARSKDSRSTSAAAGASEKSKSNTVAAVSPSAVI